MSKPTHRRRRILKCLGILLALGVALLVAMPLWVPWVIGPLLQPLGVQVDRISRVGMSRLRLEGVAYEFPGGDVRIANVFCPQLPSLAWLAVHGPSAGAPPSITASNWVVSLHSSRDAQADDQAQTAGELLDTAARITRLIKRWVPSSTFRSGQVRFGDSSIVLPATTWDGRRLATTAELSDTPIEAELNLDVTEPGHPRLEMTETSQPLKLNVQLQRVGNEVTVEAASLWQGKSIRIESGFSNDDRVGWPDWVRLELPKSNLPFGSITVPGYQGVTAKISGTAVEQGMNFTGNVMVSDPSEELVPLELDCSGGLDQEGVTLRQAQFTGPALALVLDEPLTWKWRSPDEGLLAQLNVAVLLDQQKWLPATGTLDGSAEVRLASGSEPTVQLTLAGNTLEAGGLPWRQVQLAARTEGALLTSIQLELESARGGQVSVSATNLNLTTQEVERARIEGEVQPELLGDGSDQLQFKDCRFGMSFEGPLLTLRHSGWLMLQGLEVPSVRPADVRLEWQGDWDRWVEFRPRWQSDDGWLEMVGTLSNRHDVTITSLHLAGSQTPTWSLTQPTQLRWSLERTESAGAFAWQLGRLRLENAQQTITLSGTQSGTKRGSWQVATTGLDNRLLNAFLTSPLPEAKLDRLAAKLDWDAGPISYELDFSGQHADPTYGTVYWSGWIEGDERGLRIERLEAKDADRVWARLAGSVPCVFGPPGGGPPLKLPLDRPLELNLQVEPSQAAEAWLQRRYGWKTQSASAKVELGGRLDAPTGQAQLRVEALSLANATTNGFVLPNLGPLELNLKLTPEAIRLESLRLDVAGQPIVAQGELPLPKAYWEKLLAGREAGLDLSQVQARLDVAELGVASLGGGQLQLLRPQGVIRGGALLEPGFQWEGEINIENVSTRALPMLGPVRNVRGRLSLEANQTVAVTMDAEIGGESTAVRGWIDYSNWLTNRGAWPTWDLKITGAELPLARQAGLIVRGDLDLEFVRLAGEQPLLAGDVEIGRSFFLSDLDALLGVNVRTIRRAPPYFSVEREPLASWRLDLRLQADSSIHVKSPFYRGVHSVNTRLIGTLKEPALAGDVRIVTGTVLFPYTAMPVRQGILTFNEQNPEAPRVVLLGTSRTFGYDLRMDVSGTLTEPVIQFSSTPGLTSEEILMMITAGELPRNELTYKAEDRLAKLATLIGKDILNKLGAQDAGEERLIMRSGEGISTGGRVTHYVEYRLTDIWALVGEYDEFDAINAGIKWRIIRR